MATLMRIIIVYVFIYIYIYIFSIIVIVHPALSLLVLQFQWRKSIGSVSSAKFLQELSRAFAERGRS